MKKILIIEDEHPVRTSICDLLEEVGYRVYSAENGTEGAEAAHKILPDLIICDIMMPGMDGYGVIKKLSENETTSVIPFIFLTAKAEMNDLRAGMDLGADDYIVKPFKAAVLLNAVKTRLLKSQKIREIYSFSDESDQEEKHEKLKEDERIFLSSTNKTQFVKVSDIVCITAESEYSVVHMSEGSRITLRKLLKEWETILPEVNFLRIHRSTIINLSFVESVEKWFKRSFIVKLKGINEPFTISQRYAARIKTRL